jgi:hypothetical protein
MRIQSIGRNITIVELKDLSILVSYSTPVCCIRYNGKGALRTDEFFSVTTSKHINQWLSDHGYNPKLVPTINQEYFDNLLEDNK